MCSEVCASKLPVVDSEKKRASPLGSQTSPSPNSSMSGGGKYEAKLEASAAECDINDAPAGEMPCALYGLPADADPLDLWIPLGIVSTWFECVRVRCEDRPGIISVVQRDVVAFGEVSWTWRHNHGPNALLKSSFSTVNALTQPSSASTLRLSNALSSARV